MKMWHQCHKSIEPLLQYATASEARRVEQSDSPQAAHLCRLSRACQGCVSPQITIYTGRGDLDALEKASSAKWLRVLRKFCGKTGLYMVGLKRDYPEDHIDAVKQTILISTLHKMWKWAKVGNGISWHEHLLPCLA